MTSASAICNHIQGVKSNANMPTKTTAGPRIASQIRLGRVAPGLLWGFKFADGIGMNEESARLKGLTGKSELAMILRGLFNNPPYDLNVSTYERPPLQTAEP